MSEEAGGPRPQVPANLAEISVKPFEEKQAEQLILSPRPQIMAELSGHCSPPKLSAQGLRIRACREPIGRSGPNRAPLGVLAAPIATAGTGHPGGRGHVPNQHVVLENLMKNICLTALVMMPPSASYVCAMLSRHRSTRLRVPGFSP
jgi:hypothetical protein